jgi:hypothetical protein
MLDGVFSHDRVTDLLTKSAFDNKALWRQVKPLVRKIGQSEGVLIVDDSIAHKPHSAINGLVCSHYDHTMHVFANVCAFVKLEQLKLKEATNQFALKARLYLKAIKAAFTELSNLKQGLT